MSDSPVDIQWKNVSQKIPAQNSVCLIENGELVIRRGGGESLEMVLSIIW